MPRPRSGPPPEMRSRSRSPDALSSFHRRLERPRPPRKVFAERLFLLSARVCRPSLSLSCGVIFASLLNLYFHPARAARTEERKYPVTCTASRRQRRLLRTLLERHDDPAPAPAALSASAPKSPSLSLSLSAERASSRFSLSLSPQQRERDPSGRGRRRLPSLRLPLRARATLAESAESWGGGKDPPHDRTRDRDPIQGSLLY
mmetsp:Transcript_8376/g.26043  ORF Transcript_8376/g.26043 Transcript_8376/m.26043 type:complete len:203 (+) Transcript_8376:1106-1714(+)